MNVGPVAILVVYLCAQPDMEGCVTTGQAYYQASGFDKYFQQKEFELKRDYKDIIPILSIAGVASQRRINFALYSGTVIDFYTNENYKEFTFNFKFQKGF